MCAMCQPSIMLEPVCKWLVTGTLRPTPRPFRQRRPIRGNGKTFRIKSVHPSAGARQSNNWLKLILNHVCMDLEPSASRNRRTADRHSFPPCYWIHANTVSSVRRTAGGCVFPDRPCRMTAFLRRSFTRLVFMCACKYTTHKDRVTECAFTHITSLTCTYMNRSRGTYMYIREHLNHSSPKPVYPRNNSSPLAE